MERNPDGFALNPMLRMSLSFLLLAFVALTISRVLLGVWQVDRLAGSSAWLALLQGGVRIDLSLLAMIVLIPMVLSPWFGARRAARAITAWWYRVWWVIMIFMEAATPQFITEYDTRPNRLFFEYLYYPQEVFSMLWTGYKLELALIGLVLIAAVFSAQRLFRTPPRQLSASVAARSWPGWRLLASRTAISLLLFIVCGVVARGTLSHRGVNPAFVAFTSDRLINSLALNSTYSVLHAAYAMKYENFAAESYGQMDDVEVVERIRRLAGLPEKPGSDDFSTLHWQSASAEPEQPLNLVVIVEESLGAQYSERLGGLGLTPELDRLAAQGWWFERMYATGTRSVRGLEALSTGFFPTPARAVIKLPRSQSEFFSIASLLHDFGYQSRFVYGGESHFDNMKGFFLGNGFDQVHDLGKFSEPEFVGSWGASDDDMFAELDQLLQQDDKPSFTLAFSVSNHTPWEYPDGRIAPVGDPASVINTVRYADHAIGSFFEQARQRDYWNNTVFLVVADHDARVHGADAIPLRHFHIPALILGKSIAPRSDKRLVSQVDMPPTLLSLLGIDARHPMLGVDLTQSNPNRALMQYGDTFGYWRNDHLVTLRVGQDAEHFRVVDDSQLEAAQSDHEVEREALAQVLWASRSYARESYRNASDAHSGSPAVGRLLKED